MTLLAEIQPADVYHRVGELDRSVRLLAWVVGGLFLLKLVQIVRVEVQLRASRWVGRQVVEVMGRVARLLELAERHGSVTDHQKERTNALLEKVEVTAEMLSQSATHPPTVVIPAERVEVVPKAPPPGQGG